MAAGLEMAESLWLDQRLQAASGGKLGGVPEDYRGRQRQALSEVRQVKPLK
jgi:hypothetical protein